MSISITDTVNAVNEHKGEWPDGYVMSIYSGNTEIFQVGFNQCVDEMATNYGRSVDYTEYKLLFGFPSNITMNDKPVTSPTDWSKAPEDATDYGQVCDSYAEAWYRDIDSHGFSVMLAGTDNWVRVNSPINSRAERGLIPRPEVKPVTSPTEINAITALYAFAGWLTSMNKPITFSANHWATPAADMVAEMIKLNNIGGECDFDNIKIPSDFKFPVALSNSEPKPVTPPTFTHGDKVYQVGAIYEFSDDGSDWFACILESTNKGTYRWKSKHEVYKLIRECTTPIGTITDAPMELIHGNAYQFTNIEDNTIHGIYDEDEHSFKGTCVEWCVSTCTNIKPLTVEVTK